MGDAYTGRCPAGRIFLLVRQVQVRDEKALHENLKTVAN